MIIYIIYILHLNMYICYKMQITEINQKILCQRAGDGRADVPAPRPAHRHLSQLYEGRRPQTGMETYEL